MNKDYVFYAKLNFLSFEQKLIHLPSSVYSLTDSLTHSSVRIVLLKIDKGFLQISKNSICTVSCVLNTVRVIKPYRDPVHKCTGSR